MLHRRARRYRPRGCLSDVLVLFFLVVRSPYVGQPNVEKTKVGKSDVGLPESVFHTQDSHTLVSARTRAWYEHAGRLTDSTRDAAWSGFWASAKDGGHRLVGYALAQGSTIIVLGESVKMLNDKSGTGVRCPCLRGRH